MVKHNPTWKKDKVYSIKDIRKKHIKIHWDKACCYDWILKRIKDGWWAVEETIKTPNYWQWWDRRSKKFKENTLYII